MRTTAHYIKTGALSILIFIESLVLAQAIYKLANSGNYFTLELGISIEIVLVMVALLYTIALTIGAWGKWEQYLIIVVPLVTAIATLLYLKQSEYLFVMCSLIALLMSYEVYKSTKLKKLLLKEDPKIILRFSAKGLLLLFSVLGGVISLINPNAVTDLKLGERVAEFSGKHMEKFIQSQIDKQLHNQELSDLNFPDLTGGLELPKDTDLDNFYNINDATGGRDINSFIKERVDTLIEPYLEFVQPLMSVLTFGILQFYAVISYFIYMLTINLVFLIAQKTGFMHKKVITVEKEVLSF